MNSFFDHLFGSASSDPDYEKTWEAARKAADAAAAELFERVEKGLPTSVDAERVFAVIVAANLALVRVQMAIESAARKNNDTATLEMLKSIAATFAMNDEERAAALQKQRGQ